MRIASAVILVLLTLSIAAGQLSLPIEGEVYQSARLRAMGQANIANPDLQTEMFLNPAKMTQITGIFLFANPFYSRDSRTLEENRPGSSYSYFDNSENTQTNISATVGGCMSLGIIAVGGYINQKKSSYDSKEEYAYKDVYSNYTYSSLGNNSQTSNYPSTTIALQTGLSLGPIAVGLAGSLLNGTENNKSKSSSSSTYTPPVYTSSRNSSENEYDIINKGKSLTAGALLDLDQFIEASLSAKFSGYDTKEEPLKNISNGVSQPITEPEIYLTKSTSKDYNGNIRFKLSESFTLGSSLLYSLNNTDNSRKQAWYSYSYYPNPKKYEERITSKTEVKEIFGGVGITFRFSASAIFTAEFLIGTIKEKSQSITTDSLSTYNGINYKLGDINGESNSDYNMRILRIGGEIPVLNGIQGRIGAEYIWYTRDYDYWNGDPSVKRTSKGYNFGYLLPSAGLSVDLSVVTFDYTLSAIQRLSYFSSSYSFYLSSDIVFRHLMTVTIKI